MAKLRIVLDMDGVVYRGNHPIPGVRAFFERLQRAGHPHVLVTNNSTMTPEQYRAKLQAMGIAVDASRIVTSALAAARFVRQSGFEGPAYVVGEQGLIEALSSAGIRVLGGRECRVEDTLPRWEPPGPPRLVVVGMDRRLTYDKLLLACDAVRSGARLVGTNPDLTYPMPGGVLIPGAGAILAAVEACSGARAVVVGKPSGVILEMALLALKEQESRGGPGARRSEGPEDPISPGDTAGGTVVIGDRLDTDVVAAKRAGMRSILVLTGVSTREDVDRSEVRPDHVCGDLGEVAQLLGL